MTAHLSGGEELDAVVVGGGWNGLVCATVLARSGLAVALVEETLALGGAHRVEQPFANAPRLGALVGQHRAGLVPPDLGARLGMALPVTSAAPGFFVPTPVPGRFLFAGGDHLTGIEGADAAALAAMDAELGAIAADLGPAWTRPAFELEEIAARHVRPELRAAFVGLSRGSFAAYAARFGLESGLLRGALAIEALADGFASLDAPGGGAALLVRHAARRTTASVPALGRALVEAARAAGVRFSVGQPVAQIVVDGNNASGILLADGTFQRAAAVVSSADPWRLRALVGADRFPADHTRRIDALLPIGGFAKLTLAVTALPRFAALPDAHGQHARTTFLLPAAAGEDDTVRAIVRAHAEAMAGHVPVAPAIACVTPTAEDPSLQDPEGRHSLSLLVPWMPYDLVGTTWAAEEERFTEALLDVIEPFAPGLRASVVEAILWHPKKLESHFGTTRGFLGQLDDTMLFGDRLRATTGVNGLYSCAAACGPAAGVVGAAGVAAAERVIEDLELALERTELGVHR